ncbi:Hypothetical protein LUCI_4476 [Lucifera butyrica]|uniref:Molybdopterin oxidoreductase n=1 Tax=Lucifera butyrica TaxID=1351585 RepID=A0A498REE3_9FIRM|nr:DUF1667 domain-containing protein [Lucifera butyrica]VBB09190.1 Hypothetical protein LUCI_4476 [Lucifera butyrica]
MSQSERAINCIVCPMSCEGKVIIANEQIQDIIGFACQRGVNYAREEITSPKRTLTTTVKIANGELHLLPVISKPALPKDKVMAVARCLAAVEVAAPVSQGDVIYSNILNLGVDIVATRDVARQ